MSDELTLAAARLAVARGYGFQSWRELRSEVESRTRTLRDDVDAFLAASTGWRIGRARRLLDEHSEIAGYSLATAVVLGDAGRVRAELARDRDLPRRTDPRNGWTALHAACASRWHLDPERARGLLAIVRMLLDAGADLELRPGGHWSPLRCAVAAAEVGRRNEAIIRLLLERGAQVEDHDLYLAGFAAEPESCVALLLEYVPRPDLIAQQALAPPIGSNNLALLRLLLDAGADPNRYRDDDGRAAGAVAAAIDAGADAALVELLLARGADPNAPGSEGRSPYALALARGRSELADVLSSAGASADASDLDRLVFACWRGDRGEAERLLARDPALLTQLGASRTLHRAAETGNVDAVRLLLQLGVPASVLGDEGATALHMAAYSGSAGTVRVLLGHGADLEAHDTRWRSTPLDWALVGSGERPRTNPAADWVETTQALLDAGASIAEITLSPNGDKQPSPEVAELVRRRGARVVD